MRLYLRSGSLKGRVIVVPDIDFRPTKEKVRSAFFDILFSLINFEGRNFMDVFAGSGAMSFESLSRGLHKAFTIEKNYQALEEIKKNSKKLGLSGIQTFRRDAYDIDTYRDIDKVNVLYIDPPYTQREQIPGLLSMYSQINIFDQICVVGVESDSSVNWSKPGWTKREKLYGSTVLTIFYNWE